MTKRRCEAVTARGEPCKARPLRDSDFCLLHSPDSSPAELGRKGGRGRGKQLELSDRERALAALRRALDSNNAAAVVAAGKALIDFERTDPGRDWSSHTEVQQARDKLMRKVQEIAVRRGDSGLAEEIRIALGDGAESQPQVRGTSLDDTLKVLAETGGVSPSRFRALADIAERAQAKRLEEQEVPVSPSPVSEPSPPSRPFEYRG